MHNNELIKRTCIFVCILMMGLSISLPSWGNTDSTRVFQGCSGGMMLHAGYLFGQNPQAPVSEQGQRFSPEGVTFGVGGIARVNLWKYLRLGCEGYVSTMNVATTNCHRLLQPGSYIRSGCGGALAELCWRFPDMWYFVGVSGGGGVMRSLYIVNGDQSDWQPEPLTYFHRQGFAYTCPYLGLDWCMTQRVHLTFRADWLLAFHSGNLVLPTGPRLYIGFIFCH